MLCHILASRHVFVGKEKKTACHDYNALRGKGASDCTLKGDEGVDRGEGGLDGPE